MSNGYIPLIVTVASSSHPVVMASNLFQCQASFQKKADQLVAGLVLVSLIPFVCEKLAPGGPETQSVKRALPEGEVC